MKEVTVTSEEIFNSPLTPGRAFVKILTDQGIDINKPYDYKSNYNQDIIIVTQEEDN